MQSATHLEPTPPIANLKRRSGRSTVFKTIRKSFSTTSLSSVFRKPTHVTSSTIYGDSYSLDVAPSDIFERMLRDDLKTTGLADRTPYNNGAICDLRSGRSAFNLSSSYKLNASTIPTLFVAPDPKVTPQSDLNRDPSPLKSQLSITNHTPQMTEVVKKPITLHPVSLTPGYRAVLPSSTLPRRTPRSPFVHSAIKDLSEQPLSASPTQHWFDQFHARVDFVASRSAGSIESRDSPPPRSPAKGDTKPRRISFTSMSVALSTSVTDLEKRYEQCYGQKALEKFKSGRCVVYLGTPSPRKSTILTGVRCMAVANPC